MCVTLCPSVRKQLEFCSEELFAKLWKKGYSLPFKTEGKRSQRVSMHCSILFLFPVLVLLNGCSSPSTPEHPRAWQELAARNISDSLQRPLTYRAIVPAHWERKDSDPTLSLTDTTKPIAEFLITDQNESIRLTIHTFPPGIPPKAQINRWKEQFDELDPLTSHITKISRAGFIGLFLEASGRLHNKDAIMLGWSMQLAPEYARQLSLQLEAYKLADYTIKAMGPSSLMREHHQDIVNFANSFELIDELPAP